MENQRVRLSKTMLQTGLLQLLKEKEFDSITVQEICEVSQINRSTFYRHYRNQMDLLRDVESEFLSSMEKHLQSIVRSNPDALEQVLTYLYEHREIFSILIHAFPHDKFSEDLASIPAIGQLFGNMLDPTQCTEIQKGYISEFVFHGVFSILCTWLQKDEPEPVEEIVEAVKILRQKLGS